MKKNLKKIGIILPALITGMALSGCQSILDNFNSYLGFSTPGNTSSSVESSSSSSSSASSTSTGGGYGTGAGKTSSEGTSSSSSSSGNNSISSSESHSSSSETPSSSSGDSSSFGRPSGGPGGEPPISHDVGGSVSGNDSSSSSSPSGGNGGSSSSQGGSSSSNRGSSFKGGSTSESSSSSEQPNVGYAKEKCSQTIVDFNQNYVYGTSVCPSIGTAKVLVIPVWFTDSASKTGLTTTTRETVREDIELCYFGSKSEIGWESVNSFYNKESFGKFSIEGTVSEWYECNKSSSTYAKSASDGSAGDTSNLVLNATNWYFNSHPQDKRTNYDSDGDGWIDSVMLIYGHPDYNSQRNTSNDNFWAYCYWIQKASLNSKTNPGPNAYFWASYDFMYTSKYKVGNYVGGSTNGTAKYDTHTFIHEFGHLLGLDDYYDYSGQYRPAGGFSMQDENVGMHDPMSLMILGWIDPYVVTDACTIELKPFESSGQVVLLANNWNKYKSAYDEYILLEFYTPTGLNEYDSKYRYGQSYAQGPSASGLRVWHADNRVIPVNNASMYLNASQITPNCHVTSTYGILGAFTNTYYVNDYTTPSGYVTYLGKSYANYKQLQLIRNNVNETYKPKNSISANDLFMANSSFDVKTFNKQFVKGTALNDGLQLPYKATVKSVNGSACTVEITKI